MRTYAVLFSVDTAMYTIIFRDDEDPPNKWYLETDYAGSANESFTQTIVDALNAEQRNPD